jgi:hypothetical protein
MRGFCALFLRTKRHDGSFATAARQCSVMLNTVKTVSSKQADKGQSSCRQTIVWAKNGNGSNFKNGHVVETFFAVSKNRDCRSNGVALCAVIIF